MNTLPRVFKATSAFVIIMILNGCTQIIVTTLNQFELTKVAVQDDKMYLMGEFNSKTYTQIKREIEAHPEVKTLILTANPGSLDDEVTFKLSRYIRAKGLNTHLINQSVIASGAVDLFLAGKQRSMEEGAKLGVHSWSNGSQQAKDFPRDHPNHKLNSTYINDMIGSDDFYWFTIYAAAADSLYWMSPEEIQKYNLLTSKVRPASNDKTPFGRAFAEERAATLED